MNAPHPVGKHCIAEIHGCDANLLDDLAHIRQTLSDAAGHGMSTLLKLSSHRFDPQGGTALALLAESHLSLHTWPEHGYAAVDAFTCGDTADPKRCCQFIADALKADSIEFRIVERGFAPLDAPSMATA